MDSIEKIAGLRALAQMVGLDEPDIFKQQTDAQLQQIYNGCGPDWMPEAMRNVLTDLLEFFEPAFLIHDVEYQFADRTRAGFDAANQRLYDNCKKLINAELSWWREPVRKACYYLRAREIYDACEDFGWSAWIDDTPTESEA